MCHAETVSHYLTRILPNICFPLCAKCFYAQVEANHRDLGEAIATQMRTIYTRSWGDRIVRPVKHTKREPTNARLPSAKYPKRKTSAVRRWIEGEGAR